MYDGLATLNERILCSETTPTVSLQLVPIYTLPVTNSGTAIRSYGATTLPPRGARVLEVTPTAPTTQAGSLDPEGLVLNGEGTLYVADTGNNKESVLSARLIPKPDPNPGLAPGLTTSLLLDARFSFCLRRGPGLQPIPTATATSAAFNSPRGEAIIGDTLDVLDADALRAVDLTSGTSRRS